MNIILASSIFTYFIIAASYWFMPYAIPKLVQFGVRIPPSRENDESIKRMRADYHKGLLLGNVPIFLLSVVLPSIVHAYDYTIFSMVFVLVFAYLNYFRINRKLRILKEREGWFKDVQESVSVTYPYEEKRRRRYGSYLSILPSVIIIIVTIYIGITVYPNLPALFPTHFGANGQPDQYSQKSIATAFLLVFFQIGITAMMVVIGYAITRTKQEIEVSRPSASFEQQETFKTYTRDSLYLFQAIVNISMLSSSLNMWEILPAGSVLIFTLLPIFVGTTALVVFMLFIGQMGSNIKTQVPIKEKGGENKLVNKDDDKYWIGGALYYNRNDPSILVGKRFGVGWTFNFAHPATWTIFSAIIALPIVLVLLLHHIL